MNILYATDGSEGALGGARFLAALPLDLDSRIRLLTVVPSDGPAAGEAAFEAARTALGGPADRTTLDLRLGDTSGEVLEAILSASEEQPTDLVVVGTRGLSSMARFFLGSVAARLARYTSCPALLARPLRGKLDRVVLGVDGSACSEQAAAWLRRFPLPPQCEVRLVTVVPPMATLSSSHFLVPSLFEQARAQANQEREEAQERLESLVASFAAAGKRAVAEISSHESTSGLLAVAEEQNADLIVVGSQGQTGIDRFLLGSVSEKVLRHAPCSVLVVRPCSGSETLLPPAQDNEAVADGDR